MKNLFAAGMVAVGVIGLQSAQAQTKPWSVSAVLRGFYDDNYATTPKGGPTKPRDSFGFEVSPSVGVDLDLGPTRIGAGYTYGLRYYEDRRNDHIDQTHQFDASLEHQFTPKHRVNVNESFVIAQEPELLDPTAVVATPLRSEGDNIRNTLRLSGLAELTRLFSVEAGYVNTIYDYEQTGTGSRSALLDRVEHLVFGNLRWQATRDTVGLFGYQFGIVDQTSNDLLAPGGLRADVRDNRSHYAFIGADHTFTPDLTGSARVGVQYTHFPNAPAGADDDRVSPYADVNASYSYTKDGYVQLGVRHHRTQTDVVGVTGANPTLDAETTAVYGTVSHRLTAKIVGTVTAQFQNSTFNEGANRNDNDRFFLVGANLAYEINRFLTAEAGYNYDNLDSDIAGRSFDRNRVYLGARLSY